MRPPCPKGFFHLAEGKPCIWALFTPHPCACCMSRVPAAGCRARVSRRLQDSQHDPLCLCLSPEQGTSGALESPSRPLPERQPASTAAQVV